MLDAIMIWVLGLCLFGSLLWTIRYVQRREHED